MIFSDSPSQIAFERMMTQVKGFLTRGCGVMVLRRFEYTAEMCDCRLCLYYDRKRKHSVTCDTFIDPDPSYKTEDRGVTSGVIGIYDAAGNVVTDGVSYTLSTDTALNAANEAVHYVDSITFPLDSVRNTYNLTLYINSNVMGVQFTNPNSAATTATYPATLTVNWNSLLSDGANTDSAETKPAEATSLQDTTKEAIDNVSEMDGLNIHRAGEASSEKETNAENDSKSSTVVQRAYLNTRALLILGIAGVIFVTAGTVTLLTLRRSDKRENK